MSKYIEIDTNIDYDTAKLVATNRKNKSKSSTDTESPSREGTLARPGPISANTCETSIKKKSPSACTKYFNR